MIPHNIQQMEFNEEACGVAQSKAIHSAKNMDDLFHDGARWQFNILKPKMMAMEAEIQRLRAEIEDHALQARADEARREWVEDQRG